VNSTANVSNAKMGDKIYDKQRLEKRAIRVQRRIMRGDMI